MANIFLVDYSLEKAVEVDYNWVEFDDVRYHVQASSLICIFIILKLIEICYIL